MWWNKIQEQWEYTKLRHAKHPPLGREHGQSLVEFAVILPLLLLIVLGTVDLGMGFKTYIALTNASREGVRWITLHPSDPDGAKARVAEEADRVGLEDGLFVDGGYTISFSPDQSSYSAGDKVTVNVDFEYELIFGAVTGRPEIPFTPSYTRGLLF